MFGGTHRHGPALNPEPDGTDRVTPHIPRRLHLQLTHEAPSTSSIPSTSSTPITPSTARTLRNPSILQYHAAPLIPQVPPKHPRHTLKTSGNTIPTSTQSHPHHLQHHAQPQHKRPVPPRATPLSPSKVCAPRVTPSSRAHPNRSLPFAGHLKCCGFRQAAGRRPEVAWTLTKWKTPGTKAYAMHRRRGSRLRMQVSNGHGARQNVHRHLPK